MKMFRKLDNSFRPVPFWTWNAGAKENEIRWQLKELKDKGIYEFIILPLYGLELVFCSEDWWKKIVFVADECKKLGMRIWLYDEFHCPSGTAGGFVLKKYPWTVSKKLYFQSKEIKKGKTVNFKIYGDLLISRIIRKNGKVENVENYKLHPHLFPPPCRGRIPATRIGGSTTSETRSGLINQAPTLFSWKNDIGDGTVVIVDKAVSKGRLASSFGTLWSWNQEGYLDVLNPEAVKKFIEIAYAGGEKWLKPYFGNAIKGFFTDEPGIPFGAVAPSLPYTDGIFEKFERKFGYSLFDRFHELVIDTGNFIKTRHDYWSLITDLFSLSYNKQIADWCKKNNLLFTGHYMGEEKLAQNVIYNGDVFEAAKWMSVPGIDILETTTSFELPEPGSIYSKKDKRGFNITAKLLTGTAKHRRRKRILCEAFGVSPWALTLQDMKKMTDWLVAMGINLINDNLIPYSIKSFRRMCGGKYFTTGWWKDYKKFSDYCARICRMTTIGPNKADIAVLYPTTTSWCFFNGNEISGKNNENKSRLTKTEKALYEICDVLLRNHWEYDFIFDSIISKVKQYKVIILPSLYIMTEKVADKLREFSQKGGSLIIINSESEAISLSSGKTFKFIPENRIFLKQGKNFEKELNTVLKRKVERIFTLKGKDSKQIISSHRSNKNCDIIFLSNISEQPNKIHISINSSKSIEVWDPENAKRYCSNSNKFTYTFEPYESKYIVVSDKTSALEPWNNTFQFLKQKAKITLENDWQFQTEQPNLALLNTRIRFDDKNTGMAEKWYLAENWTKWEKVKDCHSPRDLDPDYLEYYWLRGEFNLGFNPGKIFVVVDGEEKKDLFVNGKRVKKFNRCIVWDRENVRFNITEYLKQGRNVIVFRSRTSPYLSNTVRGGGRRLDPADVEPMVIQGRFYVDKSAGLKEEKGIIKSGSWTCQGYSNFFGTGIYSQKINIQIEKNCRYWLELGSVRDTAEVRINNKYVETLVWKPFRVEITDFLINGSNKFEIKVSNNLANLLKRYYRGVFTKSVPAGLLDMPCIFITSK